MDKPIDEKIEKGAQEKINQSPDDGLTAEEYIDFLERQTDYFTTLPNHVKYSPCTHADMHDLCVLLVNIFKQERHGQRRDKAL